MALGGLIMFGLVAPASFAAPPIGAFEDPVASLVQAKKKKKKAKHNYRTYVSTTVSGDGSNADVTLNSGSVGYHYRKIPITGLKASDPFPFYLMSKVGEAQSIGEESWATADNYFFSEGNVWVYYGDSLTSGGHTTYNDYAPGDYRYFGFYGGTQAKKRKKSTYKIYDVTVSGTETDADATANPYVDLPSYTFYYRKVPIANLATDNLLDIRVYYKSPADADFSQDQWYPKNYEYFISNGYLYFAYGSKNSVFSDYYNNTDYRIFVYSNEKKKKRKLKKQYVKKYQLNIPADTSLADRVGTYTDGDYVEKSYFKRLAIPGIKMSDYKNLQVLRKNGSPSTLPADTWELGTFQVTDGCIWIEYGYDVTNAGSPTTYYDSGSGDYRVYVYK